MAQGYIFFEGQIEEGIKQIPGLIVVQFIYTIPIWATVMSQSPITIILMLIIFFMQFFKVGIIAMNLKYMYNENSDADKRFWLKLLPVAAFLGILYSFTPFVYSLMFCVSEMFYGSGVAGNIVIMVFSTGFILAWIQIYLASEYWRFRYYPVDGSAPQDSARNPIDTEAAIIAATGNSQRNNIISEQELVEQQHKAMMDRFNQQQLQIPQQNPAFAAPSLQVPTGSQAQADNTPRQGTVNQQSPLPGAPVVIEMAERPQEEESKLQSLPKLTQDKSVVQRQHDQEMAFVQQIKNVQGNASTSLKQSGVAMNSNVPQIKSGENEDVPEDNITDSSVE